MKNVKLFLAIIGLFAIAAACSDDSGTNENKMRVFAKGTYSTPSSKTNTPSDIVITSFKIYATGLTLKYYEDENIAGRNDGHVYKNVVVNGPWELDLLNKTTAITTVNVPNGNYKKAEIDLSSNLIISSPIYNKTIEIKGTMNGMPFVFWHDFDQILELKYDDDFEEAVINNNSADLVFKFDLNDLLDAIDISEAVDGDNDGVIEIGPNDTDGNNDLAVLLDLHIGQCGGIDHQN